MSDFLNKPDAIDGKTDDIYRVTPLQKDAKRNSDQRFAGYLSEEEEDDAEKKDQTPKARKQKDTEDVAVLSELAVQSAPQTPGSVPEKSPVDEAEPGTTINIQA